MTGSAEHKPLEPNARAMRDYVELLFGGDQCAGMLNGLIELAYTGHDSKPSRAHHFKQDELDELVDLAVKLNRNKGINIFVSPTLRKPDIKLHHRTGKEGLMGLTTLWSDLDAEGAAEAMKERARFCLPSLVVVTGRKPFLRAQGFWRLDEPMTDIGEIEAALRSIQVALGGDRAVVDASRVMRLPGSLAYPVKDGRVLELTELITEFEIDRPSIYPAGQVCRAFQPKSAGGEAPDTDRAQAGDGAADPHAKNPFTGRFDGEALLRSIRPGNWYTPMRDFVAHMVGRGRQDWEIRAMAAPYDEPGHQGITVQDLIDGARAKYNKPNPDQSAEFDFSQAPPAPLTPRSRSSVVAEQIRRRPWLYGKWLMRGYMSVMVGTGGTGKSMASIHVALSIAANKGWAGQKIKDPGGVWLWNNEDDAEELDRRIAGTAKHLGIDLTSIDGRFFVNSGVDDGSGSTRKLIVAQAGEHNSVIATPDVPDLVKLIRELGIRLLIVDPFVSTHTLNENDNPQMEQVTFLFRQIAHQADCAVLLIHHTSKPGANTDLAGNQDILRGASSIAAGARVVLTVTQMTDTDAKVMMGEHYDEKVRERCIRIDTGKGNMSAPGKDTVVLQKVSVSLGNGSNTHVEDDADEIGALEMADFSEYRWEAMAREQATHDALRELVALVMAGVPVGGEIDMTTLVSLILARTEKFGKKSTLRQELLNAIPPAIQGGIQVGEQVFYVKRSGTHKTATIYVCKKDR